MMIVSFHFYCFFEWVNKLRGDELTIDNEQLTIIVSLRDEFEIIF